MSHRRMETLGLYAKEFKLDPDVRLSSFNNTQVSVWQGADGWFMSVKVHGNKIVEADRIGGHITVRLRTTGWPTATTRNVLNAVLYGLGVSERIVKRGNNLLLDGDVPLEDQQWITFVTNV